MGTFLRFAGKSSGKERRPVEQNDSIVKEKEDVDHELDTGIQKEPGGFIGYEVLGIDSMF